MTPKSLLKNNSGMVMVMVLLVVMVLMILSASIMSTTLNQNLTQRGQTDKLIADQLIKGVHAQDYARYEAGLFPFPPPTDMATRTYDINGKRYTVTTTTTAQGANQTVNYSAQY